MSCNCSRTVVARNAEGEAFPTISTEYNLHNPQEYVGCVEDSCASPGGQIPSALMDGCCGDKGMTLLGRIGSVVARFTGSGFIQIKKGKAYLVDSFDVNVKELYHRRYQSSGRALPVLGEPLDSTYDIIADERGHYFAQKGLDTEDSVKIWNKTLALHTVIPISEFPKTHKGLLPGENALEITGFVPIAADGSPATVRQLSVLAGKGILYATQQATVASDCLCEGCQPVEAIASVVKILSYPTDESDYVLHWNSVDGPYWSNS